MIIQRLSKGIKEQDWFVVMVEVMIVVVGIFIGLRVARRISFTTWVALDLALFDLFGFVLIFIPYVITMKSKPSLIQAIAVVP